MCDLEDVKLEQPKSPDSLIEEQHQTSSMESTATSGPTPQAPGNQGTSQSAYPSSSDRQQFCVSWNSHQSNMHSAFPKLLSSEQFVDVTLACDGGSIKCHKVVLSACSDYLERLLLEIPCQHPIVFLRDMKMWELQALVEFMYRGEVYVEQQQLAKLMQAAEALQVRGLSSQGNPSSSSTSSVNSTNENHAHHQMNSSSPTTLPSPPKQNIPDYPKLDEDNSNDCSDSEYMNTTTSHSAMSQSQGLHSTAITPVNEQNLQNSLNNQNFMMSPSMEHSEALQHLEKALSACEATLTETQGMVKMEPDEQMLMQHHDKPYSISAVPTSNCAPGSPFPAIEGYQRRQRRSEAELKLASDLVSRGMTFQVASEKYNIPISTIRFYMARKGILQRRKRGRGANNGGGVHSQPSSPASPPFHMMNFRLPESLNSSLQ